MTKFDELIITLFDKKGLKNLERDIKMLGDKPFDAILIQAHANFMAYMLHNIKQGNLDENESRYLIGEITLIIKMMFDRLETEK